MTWETVCLVLMGATVWIALAAIGWAIVHGGSVKDKKWDEE